MKELFDYINSFDCEFIPEVKKAVRDYLILIALGLVFILIITVSC